MSLGGGGNALGGDGTLCRVELSFSSWLAGVCILPGPGRAGGKTAPLCPCSAKGCPPSPFLTMSQAVPCPAVPLLPSSCEMLLPLVPNR